MSETKIDKLTPEQEALIPVYQEKWRRIAFSTEPIDRDKATEVVKAIYAMSGQKEPKFMFCDSPYQALNKIGSQPETQLTQQLCMELYIPLVKQFGRQLSYQLYMNLSKKCVARQGFYAQVEQLSNQLEHHQKYQLKYQLLDVFHWSEPWAGDGIKLDFSVSVLNCTLDQKKKKKKKKKKWEIYQLIAKECGWILSYQKLCIICDRPRILSFDNQHRLHAEGTPAIQFADGYSLYSYHGVTLPEKYGKLHPHQWQSQWLLEEENAELRRVLIQGIGYSRICQELEAIELDTWREYTLLRIDKNIDFEPMNMLKMTCPSTGHIHFLRVPPNLKSARKAIKWVNWGVDAEEFSVQT